jgi:hypothetical protein
MSGGYDVAIESVLREHLAKLRAFHKNVELANAMSESRVSGGVAGSACGSRGSLTSEDFSATPVSERHTAIPVLSETEMKTLNSFGAWSHELCHLLFENALQAVQCCLSRFQGITIEKGAFDVLRRALAERETFDNFTWVNSFSKEWANIVKAVEVNRLLAVFYDGLPSAEGLQEALQSISPLIGLLKGAAEAESNRMMMELSQKVQQASVFQVIADTAERARAQHVFFDVEKRAAGWPSEASAFVKAWNDLKL